MHNRIIAILVSLCWIAGGVEISSIQMLEQSGNYAEALSLCQKEPHVASSLYFIGDYFFHGRKGINQNQILGREFYQKAIPELVVLAEAGNADAQYYLGRCYEYGKNDLRLARQWYIKAADNGNSDAMIKAAMFVAKRRGGGEKNPQAVMSYIEKAVAVGNPDGKALQASYYLEGRKDIEKGIVLAKEAAEMKSPLGQMILGGIYLRGIGSVKRDESKALELFQLSSDQGNSLVNETLEKMRMKIKYQKRNSNNTGK